MAHSLGPEEPYTRQFEPTVEAVDGTEVVLSETYFYPEGGGQPADRGYLEDLEVVDVTARDGTVVHELEREPDFEPGAVVGATIDDAFRTYAMRAHTASHAIYGAGRRLFDDIGYGGFGITDEKVRVDFETSTDIDDELLVELERLTNRAVWDSLSVSWEELPKEKALEREDIAFNDATEEGVMEGADTIRVVTIEDWDVAACGGTHVGNTREIGTVSVLERSNPGEGLTRVEFAVGPTAIQRRAMEHRAALSASRSIGTNIEELVAEVTRLQERNEELESDLEGLKDEVLYSRLRSLPTVEKDGVTWQLGTLDGFETNEIGDRAQELAGESAAVVAVAGGDGRPFVVVASDGSVDANDVVQSVTDEFGGGGGGGPTFAQGGGLDADAESVVEFLR